MDFKQARKFFATTDDNTIVLDSQGPVTLGALLFPFNIQRTTDALNKALDQLAIELVTNQIEIIGPVQINGVRYDNLNDYVQSLGSN